MTPAAAERGRLAVAGLGGALAVMLWWTHQNQSGNVGYLDFVAHPDAHAGEAVVLSLVEVLEVAPPDRFVVAQGTITLAVLGPTDGLELGQDVTIGGTFDAEARAVRQEWREAKPGRPAKKWLGLVGLVLLGALAPVFFRPTRAGAALRG